MASATHHERLRRFNSTRKMGPYRGIGVARKGKPGAGPGNGGCWFAWAAKGGFEPIAAIVSSDSNHT